MPLLNGTRVVANVTNISHRSVTRMLSGLKIRKEIPISTAFMFPLTNELDESMHISPSVAIWVFG